MQEQWKPVSCNGKQKTHKKLTWKYNEKGESHESES